MHTTDLSSSLVARILELIRGAHMKIGDRLTEGELAREFRVSRTPVRAALKILVEQGALESRPKLGYFLRADAADLSAGAVHVPSSEEEDLYLDIARDRVRGLIPEQFSESSLLRRYKTGRAVLLRVLFRMAEEGSLERGPGQGWIFQPGLTTQAAIMQSFRFRILVEPAGVLEPTFTADRRKFEDCRAQHLRYLDAADDRVSTIDFVQMNAAFHQLIAEASGNRFILQAVQHHIRLRRFVELDVSSRLENRSEESCLEHLKVLDALIHDDRELASSLLKLHIETAMRAGVYNADFERPRS